jgi:hypothetical protein
MMILIPFWDKGSGMGTNVDAQLLTGNASFLVLKVNGKGH